MVENIYLDETQIPLTHFVDETVDGLYKVTIEFNVTSEAYHDIAVLLYRGRFDVEIPDKDKKFKGEIYIRTIKLRCTVLCLKKYERTKRDEQYEIEYT
ncbi:DUF3219 family protein [Mammaliicoccus sciuri]|uniref:DUF3219 family protein n=1 Tax=Mammaliicoccus sciuri TaxID=1296 RepID=UPI003F5758F5